MSPIPLSPLRDCKHIVEWGGEALWSGLPLEIPKIALCQATPRNWVRHSEQPQEGAALGEGLRNPPGLQEDPGRP